LAKFGEWDFTCDRQATVDGYARQVAGGSDTCTCIWCRNFRLVRDQVYSAAFLAFLDSVGIDPKKDAEIYHNGEIEPGKHHYGGWFHFVGSLEKTGDFPVVEMETGFKVSLCGKCAPELSGLKGLALVQVEFQAEGVPWDLDEASPM
jgi:hypothetical protein